jgi:hypothetical protein
MMRGRRRVTRRVSSRGQVRRLDLLNNREQLGDVLRQWVWHGETRCIVSEYSTCRVQTRGEYVNTNMLLIL